MIDSIDAKLKQAQIEKDKDDVITHPEKVKKAAINCMKLNNVTETPTIMANGYKVTFINPQHLKMVVDGKEFLGKEMDDEINRIDMIGPEMQKEREQKRIKDIAKKEAKNVASVAKVSGVRSAIAVPMKMVESGHRTVGSLLHGLWSLMQKAIER